MIKQVNSFLGQTKKTRRIRITLISCVLFYFIFLGLIAPYIIRTQASKELSKLLQRPVQIEKVSINPFCNSISIKNFNILEQDNKEFFHWDEFYINFELSSIFTFSWNFKEIALTEPTVKISRLTATLFNFSDIIETLNKLPKAEKTDEPTNLPPVYIESFTISNGQILAKDFSRTKEKSLDIPLINLSITKFNTKVIKDNNNQYDFRILTEHDAGLHWQGQVQLSPLKSHGSLKINGAKIKNISDIFAEELPFRIQSGDIGIDIEYEAMFDETLSLSIQNGNFSLEQFNVEYKDQSPFIQLNSFKITDVSYDLNTQDLMISLIELNNTSAYSTLLETGLPKSIRLTDLDAFSQALIGDQQNSSSTKNTQIKQKTGLSKSPVNFIIKEVRGDQLKLYFTDESTKEKPHAKIEEIEFQITNLTSKNSQAFSLQSQFKINDTARFELKSEGALFPIQSTGSIQLNDFPLDFSNPYLTRFQLPVTVEQGSLLQTIKYEIALNDDFELNKGIINTEVELIDFSIKDDLTDKALFSDTKVLQAYESVDEKSRIHILGELDILSRIGSGEFHIRSIDLANAASHFAKELPFKVISGDLEFMSRAQIQFGDDFQLTTSNGAMNVSSLHIQELNENNLIKLDNFLINEVNSTLSDKKVALEKVELKGLEINAHLDENKELNFVKASDFSKLIKALEKYQTTSTTTSTELPKKSLHLEAAKPWQFSVDNIDLENMNLAFFDESIDTPAKQTISDIKFSAININNNPNHIFDSTLQATVNQHSQFLLKSQTSLNPIQNNSQLSLTPLSLKSLQGYIAEFLNASLEECKISTDTKITYSEGKAMLSGNFNSSDFQLNSLDNEPLISYGNFAINGFNIDLLNLIVKVDEVQLKEPKMFIDVDSQSQVNLTKILKETPPSKDESGEPAQKEDSSKEQVKPLIEVKKFILNNAYGKLTDQSIKPNFSISLDKFSGSVDNISNNANQQSNWFFQGFVNNYAPLKIKGNSRFLATPFALDLNLSLQNLGLTGFSPYTGTFIGYKLQEGQLSLDLDYSLDNNELDGKNKVLMKRFELGDSVDSDKAVNLPIKLGVALIRDYNKNIDLDLNIYGDINDPNFSVLNLLWKVFSNIIVKAATSPFSLLGNLASSGQDDLNLLKFEAGSSELNEEEKTKLHTLSDALEKRPSLALNITGYFENEADTEQLKKTQLDTIIKRRIALLQKEEPDSDMLERRALSLIYEEKSGESWKDLQKRLQTPINLATKNTVNEATNITQVKTSKPRSRIRNGKFKSRRSSTKKKSTTPPSTERQTELLAPTTDSNTTEPETPQNIEVVAYDFLLKELVLETDELEQLAQNRAKAVKEFLIQDLKVPVSRVFLLAPKEAKNQRFVELNLDAL